MSTPIASKTNQSSRAYSYVTTPVTIVPMTCRTPDVTVPMGTYLVSDFPDVGSRSRTPASFYIEFRDCPAGTPVAGTQSGAIHSIQYQIDPISGTLAPNVAALTGASQAGGIGVQLTDMARNVLPLSTLQTVVGYEQGSGGDFDIPLQARYYRTGTVTPGPANSTMTLTVKYQ